VFYPQIDTSNEKHIALDAPVNARFLPLAPGQELQPIKDVTADNVVKTMKDL